MSRAGGPARGPAATNNRAKRSTAPPVVIAVEIAGWRLNFAVDDAVSTGALRDLAQTVTAITGCDPAGALAAVLDGFTAPPVPIVEAAA